MSFFLFPSIALWPSYLYRIERFDIIDFLAKLLIILLISRTKCKATELFTSILRAAVWSPKILAELISPS